MSQKPHVRSPAVAVQVLAPGKQDMRAQGTQAVEVRLGWGPLARRSLLARLPAGCPAMRPSAPAAQVCGPLLLPRVPQQHLERLHL